MYSTWFSMESAGYWERMRACLVLAKDETWDSSSPETWSSRTIGGCGERGGRLLSLREETAEGLRDGGNELKLGCRWRPGCAKAEADVEAEAEADEAPLARLCITSAIIALRCWLSLSQAQAHAGHGVMAGLSLRRTS